MAELLQRVSTVGASRSAPLTRVHHELRVLRRLVGVVHTGEAGDLAGERLLVQALGIAVLGELLDGRVDVDLDELADQRPDLGPFAR